METVLKNLESVLCDPEGECCITGSIADCTIIDEALNALHNILKEKNEFNG